MIFTKSFLLETLERAIKTAAQAIATFFTVGELSNLFEMNWQLVLSAAATGFAYSVLTSIASAPFGREASPSLVSGEPGLDEPSNVDPARGAVDLGTVLTILLIVILVILILRLI